MLAGCSGLFAQHIALPQPVNVLQLQASGTVEVQQDTLAITLTTTKEGPDAAAVQNQLKALVDPALAEAKRNAEPGRLDVRTGNFSLYPRYGRDGRIASWNGTAEVVLEGKDFARIAQVAGRIQGLTVGSTQFTLSRDARIRVEGEAQAQAIDRFKAKAAELSKGFGFAGYTLREINVSAADQGFVPMRARAMAMEAKAADAPIPVEAGKSSVTVTVSGSVQMR